MREEIYLVWIGEYEAELVAARRSAESAKKWCNDHRKLNNGDPITWIETHSGYYGESQFSTKSKMPFVDSTGKLAYENRAISGTAKYSIEPFVLDD